ncbi:biotin-dependent carboxyltransferase family protein [Nonomuraea rosea]|uniref:Biotin-dependent carboxyltransferase family protein n=1 Tax=Nonomuraea rosea TaxID=638574 RepID=A0ABP6YN14_9ACTN
MIKVIRPGPLATVQDLGRPGYGEWGIAPGGAADRRSFTLANRLVGNPETAACVEITCGGFTAMFARAATVALTGAPCPIVVGGRPAGMNAVLWVPRDAEIALGSPAQGLRTYLSVRGGIDTPCELGSRATDLAAGLGTGMLGEGDELHIGAQADHDPRVDLAPVAGWPVEIRVRATLGPRHDWFTPDGLRSLGGAPYTVTPDSDRVGIRFTGPPVARAITTESPSEPAIRGVIEIPPDGQPIMLHVDHPTTCGYPVVAVADPESVDLMAQARPGQQVRFRLLPPRLI